MPHFKHTERGIFFESWSLDPPSSGRRKPALTHGASESALLAITVAQFHLRQVQVESVTLGSHLSERNTLGSPNSEATRIRLGELYILRTLKTDIENWLIATPGSGQISSVERAG